MNDTLKYVYFKVVCNYICTPTPMYIIPLKIDSSLLFLSGLPICLFYQYRYICAKMSDAERTTEQLRDSGGLAAIARMLREQQESKQNNNENKQQPPEKILKESKRTREEDKEEKKKKRKKEKKEKKEKKAKKREEKSKNCDVNTANRDEDVQMLSNKRRELWSLLDTIASKKDSKDLKTTKAKVNAILDAVVLNVSKRSSTYDVGIIGEQVHSWRKMIREHCEEEEGDDRGNVDAVLNVLKQMLNVIMVSSPSLCSENSSTMLEKFSPFASQLRAFDKSVVQ